MTDLSHLLILGHGSHDTYGGLAPAEFAKAFADNFEKTFTAGSKMAVNHLYLVGCNIGLFMRMVSPPHKLLLMNYMTEDLPKLIYIA